MKITGCLEVSKSHPDIYTISRNLSFPNPFEEAKIFLAYFDNGSSILIPRGYPVTVPKDSIHDLINAPCTLELAEGYALRDYQMVAVDEIYNYLSPLDYGQLLFSAGTGSGKSYSLAGLLTKFNQKTLILSHLTMLSTQMYKELSANLYADIKILDAKDFEKKLPDIAICSFQLLSASSKLLEQVANTYSIVCVDEADNAFSETRLKVLFSLKNKYTIIITATPTKELMQQTKGIQYLYGGKEVYMIPPDQHKISSKHMMLDFRPAGWVSPLSKSQYKSSLGKFLLRAEVLPTIATICKALKDHGVQGTYWVIADLSVVQDRVEKLMLGKGLRVAIIRGTTKTKDRVQILEDISSGLIDILIGSAPLSAGISIPQLSVGFRVLPNSSSEELLEQQKGRLNRYCAFKDKQHPIWIDLILAGSLEMGAKRRYKAYKESTLGVTVSREGNFIEDILREIYGEGNKESIR